MMCRPRLEPRPAAAAERWVGRTRRRPTRAFRCPAATCSALDSGHRRRGPGRAWCRSGLGLGTFGRPARRRRARHRRASLPAATSTPPFAQLESRLALASLVTAGTAIAAVTPSRTSGAARESATSPRSAAAARQVARSAAPKGRVWRAAAVVRRSDGSRPGTRTGPWPAARSLARPATRGVSATGGQVRRRAGFQDEKTSSRLSSKPTSSGERSVCSRPKVWVAASTPARWRWIWTVSAAGSTSQYSITRCLP